MRRKEKAMNEAEIREFIEECPVGRLGTSSGNMPYITPVNYVYNDGCIYFHCAMEGHKLDNIRDNENVCFEVDELQWIVRNDNPCSMSANYRSVVMFGTGSLVSDEEEKLQMMRKIVDKYSDDKKVSLKLQKEHLSSTCVVKIKPVTITGKKSINNID